jgi:hypothetical protein
MEEAVRASSEAAADGAARVVAPLLKRNLLGAWLLVFIVGDPRAVGGDLPLGPNATSWPPC